MSLDTQIQNLVTRSSTEAKALRTLINGNAADLAALTTTDKASLVAAINWLKGQLDTATGAALQINDTAPATTTVYSSQKTVDAISSAVAAATQALVNNAPGVLDTLAELSAAIGNDADFAASITTLLGAKVGVTAQSFTAPQQAIARANIGAAAAADIGSTDTNYVAIFESGLV